MLHWLAGAVHLRDHALPPDVVEGVCRRPPGPEVPELIRVDDGPAALAQTGVEPFVADDGAVILLAGHLEDQRGRRHERHEALRLADGLRRGDPADLERATGHFTVVVWDAREHALTIVRDAMGSHQVAWRRDGDVFRFATTVEQLLDPGAPFVPDDDVVAWHLRQGEPDLEDHTYHAAVRRLGPGRRLLIRRGTVTQRGWHTWPAQPPRRRRSPADAAGFRDVLAAAVERGMDRSAPHAMLLSGGLDSSAVAALLAERSGALGVDTPRAYTCRYPENPDCDELIYSAAVAEQHGITQVHVPCDDILPLADLEERLPWMVEPMGEQIYPAIDRVLAVAAADGARVMHWGHGGGHITAVGAGYLTDFLRQGRVRDVAREIRGQSRTRDESALYRTVVSLLFPLVPWRVRSAVEARHRGTRPAEWLASQTLSRARPPLPPPGGRDAWWFWLHHILVGGGFGPLHGVTERRARRFGLGIKAPFFDERVIDYVLRLPADAHYRQGRSKVLLRDAMGSDYPRIVRERLDKASIERFVNVGMRQHHAPVLRRLAANAVVVDCGWVEPGAWTAALDRYLGGDDALRLALWRTFTLEIWLRSEAGRNPGAVLALT